jgi:arabinofuranan 3-O-arabinosyltransferase
VTRPFLRALAASAALILITTVLAGPRVTREMPDFKVYWQAAARAASAEPLYRTDDQHYQFKYLPAFALLAAPLAALTLETAKTLWLATSLALMILLLALSVRLVPERRVSLRVLSASTLIVMSKFYGHEMVLGQVNLLFGCVAVVALLMLRGNRDALAGGLLALAIVVKPYAVIFLPWLGAIGRWRAAAAAAAGLVVALALPALTYGVDGTIGLHREWWATVTSSTAPNLLNQDNVSLVAMYAKWIGPGPTATRLAAGTGATLLVLAVLVVGHRRGLLWPEGLEGALLLTLIPLLSPQGWDYVFLIATPAVIYVVNFNDRLPPALRLVALTSLAVIGFSLFDILGRANYARFMQLSIISVCFLIVVATLAALRFRRAA